MIRSEYYSPLMTDIWSSGVVLFAMVCGVLPFQDKKTDKLYKKILNVEFTFPDGLTEDFKDLLSRILVSDPLKRYNCNTIRRHKWYYSNDPEEALSSLFKYSDDIDDEIVEKVSSKFSLNKEKIIKSVKNL